MRKSQNSYGHHIISAENGMTLHDGESYTKIHISHEDIDASEWTEVKDSDVPVVDDEPAPADYQAALREMGVDV